MYYTVYQRKCSSCFETSDVTKLGTQMNRELREEIGEGGKYVIVLDWLKPQTMDVCNLAKKLNMLLECQMHFVLNVLVVVVEKHTGPIFFLKIVFH